MSFLEGGFGAEDFFFHCFISLNNEVAEYCTVSGGVKKKVLPVVFFCEKLVSKRVSLTVTRNAAQVLYCLEVLLEVESLFHALAKISVSLSCFLNCVAFAFQPTKRQQSRLFWETIPVYPKELLTIIQSSTNNYLLCLDISL